MQQAELNVIPRQPGTKSSSSVLRSKGLVLANIYGPGVKNESCSVVEKEFRKACNNNFESNFIFTLKSESGALNGKKVVIKNLERDSVTWNLLHADLYEIAFDRPLTVSIPLHYTGTAEGVKNSGGILQIIRRTIRIKALPSDLPEVIEVDISPLALGQSLHIADLKVSDKIKILDAADFTLVAVVEAEKEEVVVPTAAAAEGAGAAAAAGTGATSAAGATAAGTSAAAGATAEKGKAGGAAKK